MHCKLYDGHDRITVQKKSHEATFFDDFWIPCYNFSSNLACNSMVLFFEDLLIYQGRSPDLLMLLLRLWFCWHLMTARSFIT